MKRALMSFAAVTMVLATPVLLSGCATTSENATAKTNPAEMLASQQMARRAMDMQNTSAGAAGRAPGPSGSSRK